MPPNFSRSKSTTCFEYFEPVRHPIRRTSSTSAIDKLRKERGPRPQRILPLNIHCPPEDPRSLRWDIPHYDEISETDYSFYERSFLQSFRVDEFIDLRFILALRTYHPALRYFPCVWFGAYNSHMYFVVWAAQLSGSGSKVHQPRPLPLQIARYAIYIERAPIYGDIGTSVNPDPLSGRPINRRRIVDDASLTLIRSRFKKSVGMRVLSFGEIVILFPDVASLEAAKTRNAPAAIGELFFAFEVLELQNAPDLTKNSKDSSIQEDVYSVGAKIALPALGIEAAWTAFRCTCSKADAIFPRRGSGVLHLLEWLLPRDSLKQGTFRSLPTSQQKEILYDVSDRQLGTVTHVFDESHLPPHPILHEQDLCLITGPDLPKFVPATDLPVLLPTFAEPEAALEAGDVFLVLPSGNETGAGRRIVQGLVCGVDYYWRGKNFQRSLIWRTDPADGIAGLGSLLYMGTPDAPTSQGIVFKNFEAPCSEGSWSGYAENKPNDCFTFSGGFFLPDVIKTSRIIVDDGPVGKEDM